MPKKYQVVLYYKRPHAPEFDTLEQATAFLRNRALNSKTTHYAELWKIDPETENGEQIGLYENSNFPLTLAKL